MLNKEKRPHPNESNEALTSNTLATGISDMNIVTKTDLTFQNFTFSPIIDDGQVWLTSTEIAKVLKYKKTDAISQIYARNADEFTDSMTMTLSLSVNGINNSLRNKLVRVYSLRGAHLIAMFATGSEAKKFRKWVLDILDREVELSNNSPMFNYHYPMESADVHDRSYGNVVLNARRLVDERNPAPELELIEQLQKDGFDVSGVKARIYALHDVAETTVEMEDMFNQSRKMIQRLNDNFKWAEKTGGLNFSYEGEGKGLPYGGYKKRRIGCH
ncbi:MULTISPECIES: BRO-N domain-containing protein [Providencia]|uniref:BRO-N domain-containing protein n=1 Tax=Providencia TaxID=586 RepID=UPI001E2AE5DE|nr:BRO family protein [Providencia sp. PROV208]